MDLSKYLSEVSQRLMEARKLKRVSQRKLASHLEMNGSSYQKIESGQTELKLSILIRACQFLEVDFKDILQVPGEVNEKLLHQNKELIKERDYLAKIVALQEGTIANFKVQEQFLEYVKAQQKKVGDGEPKPRES